MADSPIKILTDSIGADIVEAAKRNLGVERSINGRKRRRVASGALRDSLAYKNLTRYGNPVLQFTTNSEATKKYAYVIEEGRRPGATPPPIAPILQWLKDKGIRPRDPKKNQFIKISATKSKKYPDYSITTVSQAFAIAKGIGKAGIPPVPFFHEAIESVLEQRGPEYYAAIKKTIELRLNLK